MAPGPRAGSHAGRGAADAVAGSRPAGLLTRTAVLLGLAGLALATWLVLRHGLGDILAVTAGGGLGIVLASLFHAVPMAFYARAWQVLLPGARIPGIAAMTWLIWVREAVNELLPVARVGGEVVTGSLLMRRGVRAAPAVASIVVGLTVSIGTQLLFTLLGIGLLLGRAGSWGGLGQLGFGAAATAGILALLLLVQRVGVFETALRVGRSVLGGRRWPGLTLSAARFDRAVRLTYRRPVRILACAFWQLAGWGAGAVEIWLILAFLPGPARWTDALAIEAAVQAISSVAFAVPGALGVQEGGFLLVGRLLGLPPDIALALALARRARDVIVFAPALLLWQGLEGWRALRPDRLRARRSA